MRIAVLFLAACSTAMANVPLAENSRLGVPSLAQPSHPGISQANSFHATGISKCLCDERRRSRSTGKERDTETGLDYFGARYLSGAQGRFTSPDPLLSSSHVSDPQSWNRYTYAANNPLRYIDPFGLYVWGAGAGGDATDDDLRTQSGNKSLSKKGRKTASDALAFRRNFREALSDAQRGADAAGDDAARRGVYAYGNEGLANGVTVTSGAVANGSAAETQPGLLSVDNNGYFTANVAVVFGGRPTAVDVGHEGSHVADRRDYAGEASRDPNTPFGAFNLTKYGTEFRAYGVSAAISRGLGQPYLSFGRFEIWNSGWRQADRQVFQSRGINGLLEHSPTYLVTPANQGALLYGR